jgi:hypothetical protein
MLYNTSSCCPSGWSTSSASLASSSSFPYSIKCLKYFDTALSFAAAEATCAENGGHLATIASYDENLFVGRLSGGQMAWIGLNDRIKDGAWAWMDPLPSITFTGWSVGEPGNTADKDCVQINHPTTLPARWGVIVCSTLRPFVCGTDTPNMDVLSGISTNVGCGQRIKNLTLSADSDIFGRYALGQGYPGSVPMPYFPEAAGGKSWTFSSDEDGSGGLLTVSAQGPGTTQRLLVTTEVATCPAAGCWPPPPPPPAPPPEKPFLLWSAAETWSGTRTHPGNPMNVLKQVVGSKGVTEYVVIASQEWAMNVPSACDNVWIPPWKKVSKSAESRWCTFSCPKRFKLR